MSRSKWSRENLQLLQAMYSDPTCSKSKMINRFGCGWRTIVACCNSNGFSRGLNTEYILAQADAGRSPSALATELEVSKKIILDIFEKNGKARARKTYRLPADEVIRRYKQEKVSPTEMAKEYGCTVQPIYHILKKNGIEANSDRDYLDTLEDENLFDTVDTEAKAYLLGLIAADGCLHQSKSGGFYLSLSLVDEELVKRAAELLGWKGKIQYKPAEWKEFGGKPYLCKPTWRFTIGSKKLVSDIVGQGIGFNKSEELIFPRNLRQELWHHFIRGFFDGDGCVTFTHDAKWWTNGVPHVSIIGLKSILNDIQEILINECGISKTKLVKEKRVKKCSMYNLHYRGEHAVEIRNYLYRDATVFLDRKRDRLYSVEIPDKTPSGYSIAQYCEKFGFNKKTVSQWIDKGILTASDEYDIQVIPYKDGDEHANFMAETVSVKEAAKELGVSLDWMYQLTCEKPSANRPNTVKTVRILGMLPRIYKSELERVRQREQVTPNYYKPTRTPQKHEVVGLCWSNTFQRWVAKVYVDGRRIGLGSYLQKVHAIEVINRATALVEQGHTDNSKYESLRNNFKKELGKKSLPKGVSYCKTQHVFAAYIGFQGKICRLGKFRTEQEAMLVRSRAENLLNKAKNQDELKSMVKGAV